MYLRPHAGIPATVIACPEFDSAEACHGEQDMLLEGGGIQRVGELLHLTVDKGPQGHSLLLQSLPNKITQ